MTFYQTQKKILNGELTDDQIQEVFAQDITEQDFADILRASQEAQVSLETEVDCLDIVGTGGDGCDTFNISTISAMLCASLGIPVAKHGNRSASGLCGSANFLELLGYPLNLSPDQSLELLHRTNFCFLFAPQYNPAFRFAKSARSSYGKPTYFNLLGPLLNPVKPKYMVVGISKKISHSLNYAFNFVQKSLNSNTTNYAIIQSDEGLDEISIADQSTIIDKTGTKFFDPKIKFGLDEIKITTKKDALDIFWEILNSKSVNAKVHAVLLNTVVAMSVVNSKGFEENYEVAKEQILSGKFKSFVFNLLEEVKIVQRKPDSILWKIVQDKKKNLNSTVIQSEAKNLPQPKEKGQLNINKGFQPTQFNIICEIKPKSPSAAVIRKKLDLPQIISDYDSFGATGISVLTDEKYFGGSIKLFREVRELTDKPLLQKDFVISNSQITEAKNVGANMILLIVKILSRKDILEFIKIANGLELQVLLEVNDILEYNLIREFLPLFDNIIIGVNNRNLETFETNLQNSLDLADQIPETKWSLSGIKTREDIEMLKKAGYNGVLIGEGMLGFGQT